MKQVAMHRRRPDRWRVAVGAVCLMAGGCSSDAVPVGSGTSATTTPLPGANASTTSVPTDSLGSPSTIVVSTARINATLSAADIAAELTAIELAAAEGEVGSGQRQQLLYRYLSGHKELDDAVIAGVDDLVRPFVERIITARQFAQASQAANPSTTPPSETLPAWTIAEPLPVDELLADYQAAEAATGIDWYWLAAIHLQETRMGRIIGTSSAGAVGPMQFLPSTWAQCCHGDPTVARDAIIGAATYLLQSGGPADMQGALHTYNPSDTYVATVTAFAENLRDNPKLYAAYHEWQVFYSTSAGTVRLPIGYAEAQPVDAAAYLASHPEDAA